MARGKEAIAAANRRARAEVEAEIATYQRAVANLTAERNALREKLIEVKASTEREIRQLRAERDEASGPQTAALRLMLEQARTELQQHKVNVAQGLGLIMERYRGTFPSHHYGAAMDALSNLLGVLVDEDWDVSRNYRRRIQGRRESELDQIAGSRPAGDPGIETLRQANVRARRQNLSQRMAEKIASK